jgi:CubicO group peptidase (beta-lactamase class C family)
MPMTRRELLAVPVSLALRRERIDEAAAIIQRSIDSGDVRAAALSVRQGSFAFARGYGEAKDAEAIFLLASITKPMTATAVMVLADRGALALEDRVSKFIPEFTGGDRGEITVKHLLTHTSGLPDMLPENVALRSRFAPLKDFVAATCRTPLLFHSGAKVSYQSMGILLAAEIVERVTKAPLREFLAREVFAPLKMTRTALGLGKVPISGTMRSQGPENDPWNWNSEYWRNLGAPWGGVHSTAGDVDRFLGLFLAPDGRVVKPATAAAMIRNQTTGLNEAWGLGWMLQQPGRFSKTCSTRTFGHYGSTGTIAWCDPAKALRCVLLTTKPATQSRDGLLGPVSDAVAASAV